MRMPSVMKCEMAACAYNKDEMCHALAITVGGHGCPECDTMIQEKMEAGDPDAMGSVGACKVSACVHNMKLECAADSIVVRRAGNSAACRMYERRP